MNAAAWRETLGFGALCLLALPAGAVVLGDIEVRSQAGAPLEARIPVVAGKDEPLRGACFSLSPRGPSPLPAASLELRRSSHGASLFVRTREPVAEGSTFAIAIACPGIPGMPAAGYSVRFASFPAPSLPVSAAAASPLPAVTRLAVRDGDTLGSLAEAFFPRDEAVRARYLAAIRAENPTLAEFGDEEPLPSGTAIALPDLHAFAGTVPAARQTTAASPRAKRAAADGRAPKRSTRIATAAPSPAVRERPSASLTPARKQRPVAIDEGFRLRLSAPTVDLAPTRGMDERKRAALRERLIALEADDRTAAMLAMREDIRRLEAQVQQLKLKLATLAAAPSAPPDVTPPANPAPETAAVPAPEKPATQAAALPQPPKPATQTAAVPAPKIEAAPAQPPESRASRSTEERRKPVVIPRATAQEPWYSELLWWLRLLLVPLAGVLGLRYFARRRAVVRDYYTDEELAPDLAITEPGAGAPDTEPRDEAARSEPAHETPTHVPAEDNVELRRRYIEERFPEIANGAVALDDPRSMVKAARLLYDDGAFARAIELLQFAIEQDPDAMPAWLALFAIFRLQGLQGEFAELGRRFAERHGASDEWRDVRAIGRSLDPANPLYEGEEVIAALDGGPEGWLHGSEEAPRAPLAAELRSRLMAEASVADADLAPDPMPALRKAEIFSLA